MICTTSAHCVSDAYTLCNSYCSASTKTCQLTGICLKSQVCSRATYGRCCEPDDTNCIDGNLFTPSTAGPTLNEEPGSSLVDSPQTVVSIAVPWAIAGALAVVLLVLAIFSIVRRKNK